MFGSKHTPFRVGYADDTDAAGRWVGVDDHVDEAGARCAALVDHSAQATNSTWKGRRSHG